MKIEDYLYDIKCMYGSDCLKDVQCIIDQIIDEMEQDCVPDVKTLVKNYPTEELIEAIGIDKVQNYLRKKKIKEIKK